MRFRVAIRKSSEPPAPLAGSRPQAESRGIFQDGPLGQQWRPEREASRSDRGRRLRFRLEPSQRTALMLWPCLLRCAALLCAASVIAAHAGPLPGPRVGGYRGFVDATGTTVQVPLRGLRIVSIAPSLTEEVFSLGAGGQLVGDTIYCIHPNAARRVTKVGSMLQPSLEVIASLHPSLVLATEEGDRAETVEQLRALHIPVYVMGSSNSWSSIARHYEILGQMLGREAQARRVLVRCRAQLSAVAKALRNQPPVTVLFQLSTSPVISVNGQTFISDALRRAGGINVEAGQSMRYPRLSEETVLAQNPDFILLSGDLGAATIASAWRAFSGLRAVRRRQVVGVPAHIFSTPTPFTFAAAVIVAAHRLHPELASRLPAIPVEVSHAD